MSTLIVTATATATVQTDTPIDLGVAELTVEFDETWAPYCSVSLTCALPSEADIAQIDPREGLRVTVETGQTISTLTAAGTPETRSFDLYLIDREADRGTGQLRLEATSDEIRLILRTFVDDEPDESARAVESSLRAIVDTRLAGIGASLAAGTADYDFTRAIRVGNYARNPKAKSNSTDWSLNAGTLSRQTSGGPTGATTFMRATGAASGPRHQYGATNADWLVHDETLAIIMSAWVRASIATNVTVSYLSYNSASTQIRNVNTVVAIPANTWTRVSVTMNVFYTPTPSGLVATPNGHRGVALFQIPTLAAGQTFDVTGLRVSPSTGHLDTDYFDPDTSTSTYYGFYADNSASWLASGTSTSFRLPLAAFDRPLDSLDQQPGESDWDFLQGLVQTAGLRLFCDELAEWRLVDPAAWPTSPPAHDIETQQAINFTDRIYLDSDDSWDEAVVAYEDPATGATTYDASATSTRAKAWRGHYSRNSPGAGAAAAVANRGVGRYLEAGFTGFAPLALSPSDEITFQRAGVDLLTGRVKRSTWQYPTGRTVLTPRDLVEA